MDTYIRGRGLFSSSEGLYSQSILNQGIMIYGCNKLKKNTPTFVPECYVCLLCDICLKNVWLENNALKLNRILELICILTQQFTHHPQSVLVLGSEFCKKVEIYFCDLCKTFVPRIDDQEQALAVHCRGSNHLRWYVKKKDDLALRKRAERIHKMREEQRKVLEKVKYYASLHLQYL